MSPTTGWSHGDSRSFEAVAGSFTTDPGLFLDPPQRPTKSAKHDYSLTFLFVQDIAHIGGGYPSAVVNVLLLSLAGFQLSPFGRFWVSPEDEVLNPLHGRLP
jgi:hypothetical protein